MRIKHLTEAKVRSSRKVSLTNLKNATMPILLGLLEDIKGGAVKNEKSTYSYNNMKLPTLKYYNWTENVPVFELDIERFEEEDAYSAIDGLGNLAIVGSTTENLKKMGYGSGCTWGGDKYIVSTKVAKEYIDKSNWSIDGSGFWDNEYPTKDALEKVKKDAKRIAKILITAFQDEYGEYTDDKDAEEIVYEPYVREYQKSSENQLKKLPNIENEEVVNWCIENMDYLNDEQGFLTMTVYGKENIKTLKQAQKEINKYYKKDYVLLGYRRQGTAGQDWNSNIWKAGGGYNIIMVDKDYLPYDTFKKFKTAIF